MRLVLAVALIACAPDIASAQSASAADREAVLAVVQTFFDTMASGDVAAQRAVMVPEGRFFALGQPKPGEPQAVRTFTNQESLDRLATGKRKLRERMWNPEVRIHGPIAVVWTPYDFWIDGKFSHCGVDAFNLVKTPEGWKLAGGLYTVERTDCAPSPLGPLK
jgi:hypothetical protein